MPGPSGSSRRLTEYLKALPDRFSVVVLSAKTPDHSHIEKYQGARLLRVPVGSGDLASRIQAFERAVRRQLESEDYALAHFTDPFGGYALCELKGDYGYRLIYEAQTFPSQELRYTHPQTEGDRRFLSKIRRQELFCLMNADLVVTGSEATRAYIQSLGASEDQVRVLPAPVDLAPFSPDVLGAPDGEPLRMMYLGSQVGWQGLSTLLRAVALAARHEEVRLTVVGARHADWQPHLDDLVKELKLGDRVEFQPPVNHDDLAKVLALADVGVLPLEDVERNRVQGGPLAKASEYCAAGRPLIAADLPVTRELIPEAAGLFFPPGDSQALADRILELARDVPRRLELGRAARAHAEEALDAGLIRGKLLDLYDSLLEKRSEPVSTTSEDDLPAPTTVTGTPTNRLAALLPPEPAPTAAPVARSKAPEPRKDKDAPATKPSKKEDLPLVLGQVLDEGLDTRLVKTELESNPIGPPVVMGAPLREQPSTAGAEAATPRPSEDPENSLPIVQATEFEDADEPPSARAASTADDASGPSEPTPVTKAPPPSGRHPAFASADGEEDAGTTPVTKAPSPSGRPPVSSGPDTPESAGTTPIVKVPPPPVRLPSTSSTDGAEASAATPVVKVPPPPGRPPPPVSADAGETPAPTPIVKAPAALNRGEARASEGTGESDEAPAPTPVVRSPVLGARYEPPSHTPVVRSPFERERDEPPAPTPIIRVPTELLRELLPSRSPSGGRGAQGSGRPDEHPTPTPIVPAPSPLSSRSISARMETPAGRMPSLTERSKTSEHERTPPVLRSGPGAPDGERLPPIRGGTAASTPERPAPTLHPSAATPEADRPPALPPRAATPPPVPRQRPPTLQSVDGPPRLEPLSPRTLKASAPLPSAEDEEPEEISEDEAESLDEGDDSPPRDRPQPDEPDEISSDEVEEAEISASSAAQLIDTDDDLEEADADVAPASPDEGPAPEPVPSTLNPWFAQLAHGYCPPDGIRFDRHTPPTTFPGRDEPTNPAHPAPSGRPEVVVRGKSS
ncbi:glycosyltransferase family 4 protein [Corallococcus macrosporus]|uniref:glycosyltransferase family 4 protein n=1 Tax=Corallococcus macrosporus TaxID=35 RepID=UPI000BB31F9F|nr:glycosyltransferase [Corallococcus macrosporus]